MKRFVRAAFTASLLCATAGASSVLWAAAAQAADKAEKVSAAVGKPLSEAQKAIATKDYATALAMVQAGATRIGASASIAIVPAVTPANSRSD